MAKLQRIPLGKKPEQKRIELPEHVQVCLGELAGRVREGLLAFSVGVGLEVLHALLEEDTGAIVGERGRWNPDRAAYRHGTQTSSVALGGRKVSVERPRVRSVSGEELRLPTWAAFAGSDLLPSLAFERMVAGLSTRHYKVGLEPVGEVSGSGTSRSAVSRRFVERTRVALAQLMAKDLSEFSICALFVDGESVGDHTVVVALGIDREGKKHPLGLREGTTENEAVCRGLLSDLVDRGLDASEGILLVIDGGKGLRKAVREVFGSLGLVHRCRIHYAEQRIMPSWDRKPLSDKGLALKRSA
jgi:putative transposase